MTTLKEHRKQLQLCTYCPSLCLHVCPVSTVEANDTVSPWGKMSLAHHVMSGYVPLDEAAADIFHKCTSCGACSEWCRHDVPVADVLRAGRQQAVEAGLISVNPDETNTAALSGAESAFAEAKERERFVPTPATLLLPGATVLSELPQLLGVVWDLLAALEDDDLVLGNASGLDVGYGLWAAGHMDAFRVRAKRVAEALDDTPQVVAMSPQEHHLLQNVYPEIGVRFRSKVLDMATYLSPSLNGAVITRVKRPVSYVEGCTAKRVLGVTELIHGLLGRVLSTPLETVPRPVDCCGAGGVYCERNGDQARAMAMRALENHTSRGHDTLVSFSPECIALLSKVAPAKVSVVHGLEVIRDAVVTY